MKRKIVIGILALSLLGTTGCTSKKPVADNQKEAAMQTEADTAETSDSQATEQVETPKDTGAEGESNAPTETESESQTLKSTTLDNNIKIDYEYDYSNDIKSDVEYVVSNSSSLQEELKNIEKVTEKYTPIAESANTQTDMNIASKWLYEIWDAELNNLWNRFNDIADKETKDKYLKEQRQWIALKEQVTDISIGSSEDNGSMYPLLVNSYHEEITKNRCYIIAREMAHIKGENFVMPEVSSTNGTFIDNQDTDDVYSSLITREEIDGENKVSISLYRLAQVDGTFVDKGNGELDFTSDEGNVRGIIKIKGWDGAVFTVKEVTGGSPLTVGEEFTFPWTY